MELKIFRDTMPQAGTGCTVKAELPLETEILISDYLPPVFKLVKCFAKPVVLQKQLQPGRLQLEGYLRCTVFYQGEKDTGLCQTEQKLPFERALELPEFAFAAWTAVVEGQTEYLNCRVVNSRRIEVRGAVGLVASVYSQMRTEIITALADGGIEQKLCTLSGARNVAVLDKLLTAEGEILFAQEPAAVLDITGAVQVRELKLLSGKAVVKGELQVRCVWCAAEDPALQTQNAQLIVQQVVDLPGMTEDCKCLCVMEPIGFSLEQGQPDGPQHLTASVMLHLRGWRDYQLQYVSDAFSTKYDTELQPQQLDTEELVGMLDDTTVTTGSGALPDAGAQPVACFVAYGPAQIVAAGNDYALTAHAVATAFAQNSLAELESYEKTLEIRLPLELPVPPGQQLYPECWLSTQDVQCSCEGGKLDVRVTTRVEGAVLWRRAQQGIGGIELGEELSCTDPEISLRIYYAGAGEEVFAIAKRFHVSPAQMITANGLDAETSVLDHPQHFLVPGV